MTKYELYMDDSGHPNDQPYIVVAGYVANASQWLAFKPKWREVLSRFDLDNVFHMTDFMQSKYSNLKKNHILGSLASVVNKNTVRPFACAIDMAAYKRVNEELTLEEYHGAPFALVIRSLFRVIREWQNTIPLPNRLLTFVEEGTRHYGEMEQVLKRDGIPIPNKVSKSLPQVQPADVLAWEIFHGLKQGGPIPLSKNLRRFTRQTRQMQTFGEMIHEDDLRRICRKFNVPSRDSMRPEDTIAFHSERNRKRRRTIE